MFWIAKLHKVPNQKQTIKTHKKEEKIQNQHNIIQIKKY